jgi:hypothetical protein
MIAWLARYSGPDGVDEAVHHGSHFFNQTVACIMVTNRLFQDRLQTHADYREENGCNEKMDI